MHEKFLNYIIPVESQIRTNDQSRFIDAIRFNEPCKFTRQSQLQTSLREANYLICFVEMKVGGIIGKKQEVGP